jgi:hypothetical protein
VRNKSQGRVQLSADGRVQTVNLGQRHFPLHPEIAREPWQPDIAFFGCEHPAQEQGETTLCDGVELAKLFSPQLRLHLLENSLAHKIPTTLEWCAGFLRKPDLQIEQLEALSHTSIFRFSVENDVIYRIYERPFLHKPMFTDQLAYGNFLVFARRNLKSYNFPTYATGKEVSDQIVDEIESTSDQLSFPHAWQKNDVLMLDNTRFMHGRNPIGGDPKLRKIYSQFGYCSFVPKNYPALGVGIWR